MSKTFLFQTIQFSQTILSIVFVHTQLNVKTVLFQVIQFTISMQFSSIWPIDRTLSGATTLGLSGPRSDGNERVLHMPQSSCITGTSPSDCLVSYLPHSLWGSYPSVEVQLVYSTFKILNRTITVSNTWNHLIVCKQMINVKPYY